MTSRSSAVHLDIMTSDVGRTAGEPRVRLPEARAAYADTCTISEVRHAAVSHTLRSGWHTDASERRSVAQDHGAEVVSLGHIGPRQGDRDASVGCNPTAHTLSLSCSGAVWPWLSRSPDDKRPGLLGRRALVAPTKPGERGQTTRRGCHTGPPEALGRPHPVYVPKGADKPFVTCAGHGKSPPRPQGRAAAAHSLAPAAGHDIPPGHMGPGPLRRLRAVVCSPRRRRASSKQTRVTERPHGVHAGAERTDQGQTWRLVPVVDALHALRGRAVHRCGHHRRRTRRPPRCATPRQLMHSLGFTLSIGRCAAPAGGNQGRNTRFAGPCAGPGHSARPAPVGLSTCACSRPRPSRTWTAQGRWANAIGN